MLAMALPSITGDVGRGVMSLLSHADDDIAKATLVVVQCR
jgi:hypothetical protein